MTCHEIRSPAGLQPSAEAGRLAFAWSSLLFVIVCCLSGSPHLDASPPYSRRLGHRQIHRDNGATEIRGAANISAAISAAISASLSLLLHTAAAFLFSASPTIVAVAHRLFSLSPLATVEPATSFPSSQKISTPPQFVSTIYHHSLCSLF